METLRIPTEEFRLMLSDYMQTVRISKKILIIQYFKADSIAVLPIEEYRRLQDLDHEAKLAKVGKG
jgi:hypothetical protein